MKEPDSGEERTHKINQSVKEKQEALKDLKFFVHRNLVKERVDPDHWNVIIYTIGPLFRNTKALFKTNEKKLYRKYQTDIEL